MTSSKYSPQYIFLFVLDAVRKDHLSLYGCQRRTSLNVDKLTRQADVYNWAFAPSSYTLASFPAILTGKYPVELSNLFTGSRFSTQDFENFKKIKELGYKTAMFAAGIVISHHQTNLDEFFDFFWDKLTEKELNRPNFLYQKAEVVIKNLKRFIEKNRKERLFIVVHLMDAHGPYTPFTESIFKEDKLYKKDKRVITRVVNDMFVGVSYDLLQKELVMPKYQLLNLIQGPDGEIEDFEKNVNEYIARYDMGIYLLDEQLGRFFSYLKETDKFDQAQIIITSDHGEFLGEENIFFTHGIDTRPELINVPLIIKNPFQLKKKVINKNYSLVSLVNDLGRSREAQSNGLIYSFHPKSVSFIKNDKMMMIHLGDLDLMDNKTQHFFPTFSSKKITHLSRRLPLNLFQWRKKGNKLQLLSRKINNEN